MSVDLDFLVEDLIESVKDRSFAPISQNTFQDTDILRILNEEQMRIVGKIIREREDFFFARETTSLVAGKDHYLIPTNAVGNALKAIFWVDSTGSKRPLSRRDIDRISDYSTNHGDSSEFYFEGDEIVLMQAPSASTDSLLFVFSRRPNRLLETASCAKITAVSTGVTNTTLTVDTDLSATLSVADEIDFARSTSPFLLWASQVPIVAITATTIDVLNTDIEDVDGSVEPGITDYICPTGYTNIPMLPIEFHPALAQRGACRMLSALGHLEKLAAASSELREMEHEALALIKNRVEASPKRPSKKRGLLRTFRSW